MLISIDLVLRIATVLIFFFWWLYWKITEKEADREKPKIISEGSHFNRNKIMRVFLGSVQLILILQLLGVSILLMPHANVIIQLVGFLFVVIGVAVSVAARKTLGTNWVHAAEYQVKKKQELVTSGIYAYIRHPIYVGLFFAFIGGELVAKSYLVFGCLLLIAGAYQQMKLEETLLLSHFGEAYKKYMKRTKMFLPFLF